MTQTKITYEWGIGGTSAKAAIKKLAIIKTGIPKAVHNRYLLFFIFNMAPLFFVDTLSGEASSALFGG
jgi:hypothetical protein